MAVLSIGTLQIQTKLPSPSSGESARFQRWSKPKTIHSSKLEQRLPGESSQFVMHGCDAVFKKLPILNFTPLSSAKEELQEAKTWKKWDRFFAATAQVVKIIVIAAEIFAVAIYFPSVVLIILIAVLAVALYNKIHNDQDFQTSFYNGVVSSYALKKWHRIEDAQKKLEDTAKKTQPLLKYYSNPSALERTAKLIDAHIVTIKHCIREWAVKNCKKPPALKALEIKKRLKKSSILVNARNAKKELAEARAFLANKRLSIKNP